MVQVYRALTWDHPRGYNAVAAAAARLDPERDGIVISWDKQPLEGFESHPIEDLAARYDLIVLDHPHIGEAVARQCLTPLSQLFSADELAAWEAQSAGRSFASYRYAGKCWALPLDAATQVMAYRRDLLDGDLPESWEHVIDLSRKRPVCLSLAGPHAILTFFSIATAFGEAAASRDPDRLISRQTGSAVLDIMARLVQNNIAQTAGLNPIGILNLMATTTQVALCPLIYGYVNYATARPYAVGFANSPVAMPGGIHGSTLGGTGIAVSRRCKPNATLLDHLRWLMSIEAQTRFIPQHDGQPGAIAAWRDDDVNRASHGFFRNTLTTLQDAWVRPRYDGYIAFQSESSAILRDGLASGIVHGALLAKLDDRYAASRRNATEI